MSCVLGSSPTDILRWCLPSRLDLVHSVDLMSVNQTKLDRRGEFRISTVWWTICSRMDGDRKSIKEIGLEARRYGVRVGALFEGKKRLNFLVAALKRICWVLFRFMIMLWCSTSRTDLDGRENSE